MSPQHSSAAIFDHVPPLPRGPHPLSRDQVAASQRARLEAAIAQVVADVGYTGATIAAITQRASVSPRTFYEHFDSKEQCYLASYDTFAMSLFERVGAGLAPDADWHEFIAGALTIYLRNLQDEPDVARAFLIEIEAAGPVARRRRHEAYAAFAALVRERHEAIRSQDPTLGELPDRLYLAIVHGVRAVVCEALDASSRPRLTELTDDLLLWITATIQGAAAAREQLATRA